MVVTRAEPTFDDRPGTFVADNVRRKSKQQQLRLRATGVGHHAVDGDGRGQEDGRQVPVSEVSEHNIQALPWIVAALTVTEVINVGPDLGDASQRVRG
jgi:hypothetical protein